MNILIINHYAGSPDLGMEFRPYYLAKEWTQYGHNVLIVGGTYSHLRKKQPLKGLQTIDNINYFWIKTNKYSGNGIARFWSMIIFTLKLFLFNRKKFRTFNPDVVIASSTYPLDNYAAKKIAKRNNAKYIYEIHDLWPLSPMELGKMSKNNPFIVLMQKAENYAYKHCDKCVSILPFVHSHVFEHGLDANKLCIVPNGINVDATDNNKAISSELKMSVETIKSKYKLVVGYSGGHAISNALNTLLEVAKLCKNDNIAFVLIGDGNQKPELIKKTIDENISNVYFFDPISKYEIPIFLQMIDVLYIGWNKSPLYKYGTSPNKIFDYMLAKKPIVQAIDEEKNIIKEACCGFCTLSDDIAGIKKTLLKLLNMSENERLQLGENGYNYVLKNHDYKVLAEKFISYIK